MSMKAVYILLVLMVAALALGCLDKKAPESSVKAPASAEQPSAPSNSNTIPDIEQSGMDNDLAQMDSMFNESAMDISFSEINADTFI